MKKLLFLLVLFGLSRSASAQNPAEQQRIQAPLVRFFDAMSAVDEQAVSAEVTKGFSLLENGKVWNIDSLVNAVSKYRGLGLTRINRLDFIQTEQLGNAAWVSYYNTADMTYKGRKMTIKWLESAVLVKKEGQWKIKILHSTELKPALEPSKNKRE